MVDILTQPEEFKELLKNKWLDYYQTHRSWLLQVMNQGSSYSWRCSATYTQEELNEIRERNEYGEPIEDGYKPRRPESKFILGVVTVLEPKIVGLFSYLMQANCNPDFTIKSLGLDFDPEIELKKRSKKLVDKNTENNSE